MYLKDNGKGLVFATALLIQLVSRDQRLTDVTADLYSGFPLK